MNPGFHLSRNENLSKGWGPPLGVVGAELRAPLPNGFVRHDDASFGQ